MSNHLGIAPDHQVFATELIFESRIAAFGGSALVVADSFSGARFNLLAAARVVVDQRNVAQVTTLLAQLAAAIGGIHQIVEGGPRCALINDVGMAARLSCIDAEDNSAAMGTPQAAVSRCSL